MTLLELAYPVDDLHLKVSELAEGHGDHNAVLRQKQRRVVRRFSVKAEQIYLAVHRLDNSVYFRRMEGDSRCCARWRRVSRWRMPSIACWQGASWGWRNCGGKWRSGSEGGRRGEGSAIRRRRHQGTRGMDVRPERAGASLQSPFLLAVRLYWGWQFAEVGWGKRQPGQGDGFVHVAGNSGPNLAAPVSTLEFAGGILLALGLGRG